MEKIILNKKEYNCSGLFEKTFIQEYCNSRTSKAGKYYLSR